MTTIKSKAYRADSAIFAYYLFMILQCLMAMPIISSGDFINYICYMTINLVFLCMIRKNIDLGNLTSIKIFYNIYYVVALIITVGFFFHGFNTGIIALVFAIAHAASSIYFYKITKNS